MRTIATLLFVVIATLSICGCKQATSQNSNLAFSINCTPSDSILVEQKLAQFAESNSDSLFISIAKSFIGTPYVGGTLDRSLEESLVVNLSELDCSTFLETTLALYLTIKSGERSFINYVNNLQMIRYRNGQIDGYPSRLHYFSEWIIDNQDKGIVRDQTKEIGGSSVQFNIYFMSTHPNAYKQLKNDSSLIPQIEEMERRTSAAQFHTVYKEDVQNIESELHEGMIVGIVSDIKGLDFAHVGILVQKEGRIHLLHASSDIKEVVISELPLAEYLAQNKRQTGIAILELQK